MSRIIFTALLAAALTAAATEPGTGWVESARAQFVCEKACPPPVGSVNGQFVVPPAPATPGGDVQFFIGAQPNDASSILQTVLQFDATRGWQVVNVQNFGPGKTQRTSTEIPALPGDQITSSISCQCPPNNKNCSCNLVATNLRTGDKIAFPATISSPLSEVFGGALEVHGLAGCAALPSSHSITFTSTSKDAAGNPLKVSRWIPRKYNVGVKCNYAVDARDDKVTLSW